MRKKALVFLIGLCLATSGCVDLPEKDGSELNKAMFKAEAEMKDAKYQIRDDAFWLTAYQATDLIEETVGEDELVYVSFKLVDEDGKVSILEDSYSFRLMSSDDAWRLLEMDQILFALIASEEVTKTKDKGKTLYIKSVILKWPVYYDGKMKFASVCDTDNDGNWDYVCRGKMFFSNTSNSNIVPANNTGYGVGIKTDEDPKVYHINGKAKLSKLADLIF